MTTRQDIEDMLARMARGDHAALSCLYAATSRKLFGVVLRVLGDRLDAEDALQDVFIKVWLNAWRYRANGQSPMTWLIAVARHHAIDLQRRRTSRPSVSIEDGSEVADPLPSPEQTSLAASLHRRVTIGLRQLTPDHAEAVCFAYAHDVSNRDLAARYGVPVNTLKTRLRRSLLQLRVCLDT